MKISNQTMIVVIKDMSTKKSFFATLDKDMADVLKNDLNITKDVYDVAVYPTNSYGKSNDLLYIKASDISNRNVGKILAVSLWNITEFPTIVSAKTTMSMEDIAEFYYETSYAIYREFTPVDQFHTILENSKDEKDVNKENASCNDYQHKMHFEYATNGNKLFAVRQELNRMGNVDTK